MISDNYSSFFLNGLSLLKKEKGTLTILSLPKFLIVFITKFVNTHKRCTYVVNLGLPESEEEEIIVPEIAAYRERNKHGKIIS